MERINRKLFVDFSLYGANEPHVKREMVRLIIENLDELEGAFHRTIESKDESFFLRICHKIKSTLVILADLELNRVIEDLKDPKAGHDAISYYQKIKAEITHSLLAELH